MSDFIKVEDSLIKTGLSYVKTHEWINLNETPSTMGISDYAQKKLHDVVYVELPKVGARVSKGAPLCALESVKAIAEAHSPVEGVVIQVNELLNERPELINKDPYGQGWLVRIEVLEKGELLTPDEYSVLVQKLMASKR